jgi:hypothetical protein
VNDDDAAALARAATARLHEQGLAVNIIFRDGDKGWAITGQNFPALPGILRAIARECEAQLADNKTVN